MLIEFQTALSDEATEEFGYHATGVGLKPLRADPKYGGAVRIARNLWHIPGRVKLPVDAGSRGPTLNIGDRACEIPHSSLSGTLLHLVHDLECLATREQSAKGKDIKLPIAKPVVAIGQEEESAILAEFDVAETVKLSEVADVLNVLIRIGLEDSPILVWSGRQYSCRLTKGIRHGLPIVATLCASKELFLRCANGPCDNASSPLPLGVPGFFALQGGVKICEDRLLTVCPQPHAIGDI